MLVIFGIRGGRCVDFRVIYRHLTPIKGTCQTSKYWIPLPSTVSPYLSQVLITTPLFTIRGALSFTQLTFPLSLSVSLSLNLVFFKRLSKMSLIVHFGITVIVRLYLRLCFPRSLSTSPPNLPLFPSNDSLPRILGIQGSLDGP